MISFVDAPKLLASPAAKADRYGRLHLSHIAPLTNFVDNLRLEKGPEFQIPYFDSWDGGTNARILFLFEAPGAKAVRSGFISRNNPDETAKNFHILNAEAGIAREETVTWNIVPWYIGNGSKIRAASRVDIREGVPVLAKLLELLPSLRMAVLIGKKAQKSDALIRQLRSNFRIFHTPHPSPLFVNHAPGNRDQILSKLYEVQMHLEQTA